MKKSIIKTIIFSLSFLLLSCDTKDDVQPDDIKGQEQFPCFITADKTLSNINPNGVDYVIECFVDVRNAQLKIEPGVEIEFKPGAGFKINDGAYITAIGNDSMPIVFRGVSNTASWKGISIGTNDPRNEMTYCNINAAGNGVLFSTSIASSSKDVNSAIGVYGKLKLKKCSISNSGGNGLFIDQDASNVIVDSLKFENCIDYPICAYGGAINNSRLETSTFINNSKNQIGIFSTTSNKGVYEEVEFLKTQIPYMLITDVSFDKNVTINAGVKIWIEADKGIWINENSRLNILGTSTSPVQIRGKDSIAGFWKGIYIGSSKLNEINYLIISNGGSSTFYACPKSNILVGNEVTFAKLTINNSKSNNYDGSCQLGVEREYEKSELVNNSPDITSVCEY